jgi:hypothetical protein
MAIVKADYELQEVRLAFSPAGDVSDVTLVVSYSLKDDITGVVETQVGKGKSVWADLTPAQQSALNGVGRRFKALAETF